MEGKHLYHGSHAELLREIEEVKAVVHSPEPLHEDPLEDVAIRGIWSALLEPLQLQLEQMNRLAG